MRTLAELGLTPAQLAEVEQLDAGLVHSWLVATNAARGLERPAGFFLSGVRSGNKPPGLGEEREAQTVELAARWLAASDRSRAHRRALRAARQASGVGR